ncbi:MAG: class I SAM-dependent methyltransferase [Verrucomicrobiota bacterium]
MSVIASQAQVVQDWRDYQILACGDGMKLERWRDITLARPDPQILWPKKNPSLWDKADALYLRSVEGGGQWKMKRSLPESWEISYKHLRFKIRPTNFKHTGLFPEQASNWNWLHQQITQSPRKDLKILNLFGYTGAATIAVAAAGASVTHIDAAKGMVEWCRENAKLSGLSDKPIRYIVDDCMKFVQREQRRGTRYDGILMDPPSYGRGNKGELWKLETHLWPLLQACVSILSEDPVLFLVNAYTTGLSPTILGQLVHAATEKHKGYIYSGELGLPISEGGMLPCGIYARWQKQA